MTKLTWDGIEDRRYEMGVDHGVLYPYNTESSKYDKGVPWNGLVNVNETPEGAEPNDMYADNIKYGTLRSAETFGATVEAYTYPPEWEACDGSATLVEGVTIGQQARGTFGLSYRTMIGSAANPDLGYKIHLVYGGTASPSERAYSTTNDSPEGVTFSWEIDTTAVSVEGFKPTASLTIDSTKLTPEQLKAIEDALYGTEEEEAYLPLPDEVKSLISAASASMASAQQPQTEEPGARM